MDQEKKFWKSHVKVFKNIITELIEKVCNDFSANNFVIATQMFPKDVGNVRSYDIVVYYKTPPAKV